MKFKFTPKKFDDKEYDGGGDLDIIAENIQEVNHLVTHFDLSKGDTSEKLIARAQLMQKENLIHSLKTNKRPIYKVSGMLNKDGQQRSFIKPYKKWAEKELGYTGKLPDMELSKKNYGICYTKYIESMSIKNEEIHYSCYVAASPWNNRSGQGYANYLINDYIQEEFGSRYIEPEYIAGRGWGSSAMVKNPNYLRKNACKADTAKSAMYKVAIFNWWKENHASERQLEIIEGNMEIAEKHGSYMNAFLFKGNSNEIHYGSIKNDKRQNINYKSISFDDFAIA